MAKSEIHFFIMTMAMIMAMTVFVFAENDNSPTWHSCAFLCFVDKCDNGLLPFIIPTNYLKCLSSCKC